MDRQEAERQCEGLMREHPDRGSCKWLPQRVSGDEWDVVKVRLPATLRRDPTKTTAEAKPKPPQADDPRPAMWRDVGGPYMPG